jgi:death-on-curing protein
VRRTPVWVSKQVVLAIHERLLAEHGGAPGLRDEGLLDAALASPMNRHAYEDADIPRLAAAYAHALARNHPFADGNKRVALTVAGVFLELNGFRLEASEQDAAQATTALAAGEIGEPEFASWLRMRSSKLRAVRRRTARNASRGVRRRPRAR